MMIVDVGVTTWYSGLRLVVGYRTMSIYLYPSTVVAFELYECELTPPYDRAAGFAASIGRDSLGVTSSTVIMGPYMGAAVSHRVFCNGYDAKGDIVSSGVSAVFLGSDPLLPPVINSLSGSSSKVDTGRRCFINMACDQGSAPTHYRYRTNGGEWSGWTTMPYSYALDYSGVSTKNIVYGVSVGGLTSGTHYSFDYQVMNSAGESEVVSYETYTPSGGGFVTGTVLDPDGVPFRLPIGPDGLPDASKPVGVAFVPVGGGSVYYGIVNEDGDICPPGGGEDTGVDMPTGDYTMVVQGQEALYSHIISRGVSDGSAVISRSGQRVEKTNQSIFRY